jgi:hypothetical protein
MARRGRPGYQTDGNTWMVGTTGPNPCDTMQALYGSDVTPAYICHADLNLYRIVTRTMSSDIPFTSPPDRAPINPRSANLR